MSEKKILIATPVKTRNLEEKGMGNRKRGIQRQGKFRGNNCNTDSLQFGIRKEGEKAGAERRVLLHKLHDTEKEERELT